MSFAEVLQELPGLTLEQRQVLIRRALELDDQPLSSEDEALVEKRLPLFGTRLVGQAWEPNLSKK